MTEALHRLLDAITDGGRHPENGALVAVLMIVIGMGAMGWLD